MTEPLSRREFLRAAAAAGVAGALAPAALGAEEKKPGSGSMPMRDLGKTGLRVSLFGLGGYYLGRMKSDEAAVRVVSRALEHGVNYLDTAPSYKDGRSEQRIAKAIRGKRDGLVLATKSTRKDPARVLGELEASLRRLGTDRVDLFQMHSLQDLEDLEQRFAPGGAIEGFVKARKQGKARFLGVTGHVDPAVMTEALERFEFDTLLIPLNCVDPHYLSFVKTTLPAATKKGVGVIAMKVFAAGRLLGGKTPQVSPAECIRYAGTLPVATAILGCDSVKQVDLDAGIVNAFRPLSDEKRAKILERTRSRRGHATEVYKRRE